VVAVAVGCTAADASAGTAAAQYTPDTVAAGTAGTRHPPTAAAVVVPHVPSGLFILVRLPEVVGT
jgi:hypothetical protein